MLIITNKYYNYTNKYIIYCNTINKTKLLGSYMFGSQNCNVIDEPSSDFDQNKWS